MKSANKVIQIENEKICILLYADDIVLISDNVNDLQFNYNLF